jgi:uncharacterized protein YgfB (UPF0149 family)
MKALSAVLAVLLGILLLVLLAIGGWQLGWWMKEESTNRNTGIANESLARQQARVDEVLDKAETLADIDVQIALVTPEQAKPILAQRAAVVEQFCNAYGGLTGRLTVPASIDALASEEC